MKKENSLKDHEQNIGTYIVDTTYDIQYADGIFLRDESKLHTKCYKSFRGNDAPCNDCPLKEFDRKSESSIRCLLYQAKFGQWFDTTMVSIHWNHKDCIMISACPISQVNRNLYMSYNQEIYYQDLIEINVLKNTYEFISKNGSEKIFPAKGKLREFLDDFCFHHIYPDDQKAFRSFWNLDTLKSRVHKFGNISRDFRVTYKENEYHWFTFFINAADKGNEKNIYLCCTLNVDKKYALEVRSEEDQLFKLLDPMSGLYNHDAFMKKVKERLQQEPQQKYSIVSIDIEHFLLFNDWYGNEEGDKLLLYIAKQIKKITKPVNGIGARLGGDDFAMLLPSEKVSEQDIGTLMISWMQDYDVNVKFLPAAGIYKIENNNLSINQMCDCAALAIQSIKGNYTKRAAFYDRSMKQKLSNEQEVLFDVKNGLERGEFVVYFQPQCSARTNRIIGAEALVRWIHPTKGMIYPNDFIPVLEQSGFISSLDYFVWKEVCRFQHDRIQQHQKVVPISVNVSRMDIFQYHIAEVFLSLIKTYELDPKLIEIEITESAYIDDFQYLLDEVGKLRKAGFYVLMDDFGSGYSSLNMLKDIEIDVLKIDMKFLEMNEKSTTRSMGILESVIQMAKWLGLHMIAEGVETKKQVDNLLNLDCEYMQGYYFYRPLSKQRFEEQLAKEKLVDTRGISADRLPSIQLSDLFHKDITSEGMLSNILGGIALYEVEGDHITLKQVNDGYYRMTGCNSVDLRERCEHIIRQVHPNDLDIIWDIFKRAEKAGTLGASGIFRRYRLSGEIMWMHLHAFYIRKQGNAKMFYGSITDYSEIMKLQKERGRLLESIPGDIIEYGVKNGKVVSHRVISTGLAQAQGYDGSEYSKLFGNKESIEVIKPCDQERVLEIMSHPDTWKDHEVIEYQIRGKDGTYYWRQQHLTLVAHEEDKDIYIQLNTDVTKLKNL